MVSKMLSDGHCYGCGLIFFQRNMPCLLFKGARPFLALIPHFLLPLLLCSVWTLYTVKQVSTTGLPAGQPYSEEVYGSDTTFYVATSQADVPEPVVKPSAA